MMSRVFCLFLGSAEGAIFAKSYTTKEQTLSQRTTLGEHCREREGSAPRAQPFRSSRRLTRLPIQTTSMQLKKAFVASALAAFSVFGRARAVSFAFCFTARRLHCVRIICARPPTRNPIIHVPLAHQLCVSALSVFYCCFSGQTHARVNHFTFSFFFILSEHRIPLLFVLKHTNGFVAGTFNK